jgi:hypothetical protein
MVTNTLKWHWCRLLAATLAFGGWLSHAAEPMPAPKTPAERFVALAATAQANERAAVTGQDGWLFLTSELRHLGVADFRGEAAKAVSQAANKDAADPLPAILDFNAQLKQAGIELLLVPVPPKAAVYAELASPPADTARADAADAAFYKTCAERGLKVVDLYPAFRRARETNATPLYCKTDSHWSGRACAMTAELLKEELRARPWLAGVPRRVFKGEWREQEIQGDLSGLVESKAGAEKLRLRFVADESGAPPADWRESPVLLLGDSHTLVFHAGEDLHGTGAGLADQLALELGFPVDVVGVRGSGATPARINLLRRRDNLAGKKVVIWCFSAREFTEATAGWRLVPVIGKK